MQTTGQAWESEVKTQKHERIREGKNVGKRNPSQRVESTAVMEQGSQEDQLITDACGKRQTSVKQALE